MRSNRARLSGLAAGLVLVLAMSAQAIGAGADLPPSLTRYHPDDALWGSNKPPARFNVYDISEDDLELVGWQAVAELTADFNNDVMWGTFYSKVWQNESLGRLMFGYRVANTGAPGSESMKTGNVAGWARGWQVFDCGILDFDGDVAFDQGDILSLRRPLAGDPQLAFAWQAGSVQKWLAPGEVSSWFFVVTDAPSWTVSVATVQDGASSASGIPALVPIPEGLTLAGVLAGLGAVCGYVRRRKREG